MDKNKSLSLMATEREYVIYGLDTYLQIINQVIFFLDADKHSQGIKLILTEALNNAFKHGNKGCKEKPIVLRCIKSDQTVVFEIKDTGEGFASDILPEAISDACIMDEGGRGLFLINCYADHVDIKGNSIFITKKLA